MVHKDKWHFTIRRYFVSDFYAQSKNHFNREPWIPKTDDMEKTKMRSKIQAVYRSTR